MSLMLPITTGRRFCQILFAFALTLLFLTTSAQNPWRRSGEGLPNGSTPDKHYAVYELDLASFRTTLQKAPAEGNRNGAAAPLSLPKPTGELLGFLFEETKLFTPSNPAAAQIKTYTGRTADGAAVAHLTVHENNIQGIVTAGSETWFIASPRTDTTGKNLVEVYDTEGRPFRDKPAACEAEGEAPRLPVNPASGETGRTPSVSCAVKTYRLAVAGTADYTAYFGNNPTTAFANTVAIVNNVNAIYERDLGARFVLATGESLMYTDAAADPFTNTGASSCSELSASITNFANTVGNANFDLGITLFGQNFGGCAYVGATCRSLKGGATGGYTVPTPTSYLLEVTAHEIGHLFSAGHSHNATGNGCTASSTSAWEPGGGSTIMAYKSNCSPSFQAYGSTLYFHGGNLGQMRNYIASSSGGGCYTTGAANTSPLITTPTDATFYIPVSTPFRLYADATDAEEPSSLTYTFDQVDLGTGSPSAPSPTTPSGPVFRSFEPSARSYRYLPRMDSIVAGVTPIFESLPSVSRNLTFYTTVRDNRPGCGCQSVDTISVATSGGTPFRVTSQATTATLTAGSSIAITWDAAGTAAAPFNTAAVQVLFAADGLNYNTVLAVSTPNDGSETVTLPNIAATNGRVMVAAVGNLFFDINDANITLQTPCGDVQRNQVYPETKVTGVQGSADLQLSLTPAFGVGSQGFDGEITAADPTGILGFRNSSTDASCRQGSGYTGRYELFTFYTTVAGTYTFGRTAGTLSGSLFFTLYGPGGYNPGSVCDNFLYSNVSYNSSGSSVSFGSSFTYTLAANTLYTVAFEVYSTSAYGTYRLNITGPGPVFTETKNPANSYSYVVVNSAGQIVAITAAPDLRSYAAGTYYVYGVSHSASISLASYQGQPFSNLLYGNFTSGGCVAISNNRREVVVRPSAILPLTYVRLLASPEGTAAKLRWTVSDETDAAGAVVEHSTDGTSFIPVVTLAAGQGRVTTAEYGYHHLNPAAGKNFYRIRQAAHSGGWVYSNTAVVEFGNRPAITITPNPTSGQVTITTFSQQAFVPFILWVYNNKGQQVGQYLVNQRVYAVDLSALPAGLYLLAGDGFSERVLKQ